jgi:large subunit ribosomal protein L3
MPHEKLGTMAIPRKAIVGEKVGMTQLWDENGKVVPVTMLRVTPLRVVKVKTVDSDGYDAVQVTWGTKKAKSVTKPEAGQYKTSNVDPGVKLLELRLSDISEFEVGQEIKLDSFDDVDRVDVTAVSKGKGHAGVMKRHNFKGQGGAHGNHAKHRAPGSIGACATPGRVFRGQKMAGRMGGEKVTTLGLKVIKKDVDSELLLVKGAVPGRRGATVLIRNAVKGA